MCLLIIDSYSITMVPDSSMRSIKSLSIEKCVSSVLPSCVSITVN